MAGRVPDRDILNKPSSPPRQNRLLLIIGAIIVGTFSLDLLAPSNFSAGIVLYFFALFFSSKLRAPYAPFLVVAIISVLALGAQFGIDGKGVNPALTNRLMILATLWAVAGLALYRITTDQTHIEQHATVESDNRLRDMIAESGLAILILNHKRDRLFVNQAMADLMGYENGDEIMVAPPMALIAPHDRAMTQQNFEDFVSGSEDFIPSFEFDGLRKNGALIPLRVIMQGIEWEGAPAVQRTFLDMTDRQKALHWLEASEQRYRDLLESSPIGIHITDAEDRPILVNDALVRMQGYSFQAELIAKQPLEGIAPHDRENVFSYSRIKESFGELPNNYEIDLLHKDGSVVPTMVYWRLLEWEGQPAVQRTFVDISERKQAEAALTASEQRYRDLIEGSTLAMQVISSEHERLFVNDAQAALLGYDSTEEIMAVERFGLVAPEFREKAFLYNRITDSPDTNSSAYEFDLLHKNGTTVPVQVFRRQIIWENAIAYHCTFVDISERKRAEAALVDSEARYRDLIEGSTLGIHIANAAEQRVFVNQALADLLGYDTVDEMLVLPKFGYVALHHRDQTRSFESIDAAKGMLQNSYEIDLVKKDGSLVPVEVFWRMIDWKGEPAIQRFVIDISERKAHERALQERDKTVRELRQQLSRASQIGTMGEIASVIAHELHQPLAAIANTAGAAQRRLSGGSGDQSIVSKEMLPLIYNQASRAGRVIGGIRKLFNGRQTERTLEDINLVTAEACDLASNEFTAEIMKIDQRFQDPPPFAVIDRVQIQQVVYNLLRNAIDAMGQSPAASIIVTTRTTDDEMVEISIQDEGPGMPEEVRSKLFDPFFTTKEDGMGMGLYTCRRIVESHEGNIWTDSDGIRGTIVRFTLPETGKPVTPADSPLQRDSSLH